MKKLRSSQDQKKGRRMGAPFSPDKMKVCSRTDRSKRVSVQPDVTVYDKEKELKEKVKMLLDEIINYEKQDFADWPDGRDFLKATQQELWNINARLRKIP